MTGLIVKVQQQEQLELVKTLAGVINEYSQQTIIYVSSSITSRTLLSMAKSFRVWTTVSKLGRLASVILLHLSVRRKVREAIRNTKWTICFAISTSSAQSAVEFDSNLMAHVRAGTLRVSWSKGTAAHHSAATCRDRICLQQCHHLDF